MEVLRFRGLQDDVAAARNAADAGRLEEARQAYKRALMASPQSPFLLRELSSIERRIGDLPSALQHAQQSAQLEPTDVRTLTLLAELYEQQGDLGAAVKTYEAAAALEPSDEIHTRIEDLREKLVVAGMPLEFRQIETSPAVSRAQLAALFGVHLGDLIKRSLSQNPVVITDARASWAEPWIMEVTRVGVMEVYGNHTFQPGAVVRRSDLALATTQDLLKSTETRLRRLVGDPLPPPASLSAVLARLPELSLLQKDLLVAPDVTQANAQALAAARLAEATRAGQKPQLGYLGSGSVSRGTALPVAVASTRAFNVAPDMSLRPLWRRISFSRRKTGSGSGQLSTEPSTIA